MILSKKACKHEISITVRRIHDICGTQIAHGLQMIPIVFGINVMHINEYAGHKVKILKCSYFYNQTYVFFHTWHNCVVS